MYILPCKDQGSGTVPHAGLSLLKVKGILGMFNSNSNGADNAYICIHLQTFCMSAYTKMCFQ